jgi:hypothetical protein
MKIQRLSHRHRITMAAFMTAFACARASFATPISEEGETLIKILDSMNVEDHWIAGAVVEWRTGDPTGKKITDDGKHTHCSQFAAAACEKMGVYILRPPDYSATLLANAQFEWLPKQGRARGWTPVKDGKAAQDLANAGTLVVAVCKNPDSKKSGHIAVIRPSEKSASEIRAEGPQVTQAGGTNRNSCSLKTGFGNHKEAFERNEIKFFSHPVQLSSAAGGGK